MRRRRYLPFAVLAALASGAAAAPALAATLHATPTSTGTALPCAQEAPCRIDYALLAAASGDDVALAPGDYYTTGTTPWAGLPDVKAGVTVHGTPGQALPVLHGLMAANATPFIRVRGTLSDVALDVGSNAGLIYSYAVTIEPGALLDRALVRSRGTAGVNTTGCAMLGGTVRNTACLGSGPGTVNALTGTSTAPTVYTVRNVTAITTAQSGDGVRVGVSTQTSSMNVTNTIARGITSDVASRAGLATGDVTLTLDHSNWNAQSSGGAGTARIVPGAGNQYGPTAAVPLFADAAAGDYRIAAGSPTIDAGATDPLNGPLALGGTARLIGAATDMGAHEFVPPPPAPPAPPAAPSAPGPAATSTPASDTLAPVLSGLRLGRSWRLASTVRFTLSEAARVTLTVSRPVAGRRSGGRCRPARVTLRGPRCTILNVRGSIVVAGKAGANRVRISRALTKTRTLKPGGYLLTARAVDPSGNRGTPRTARFTIAR